MASIAKSISCMQEAARAATITVHNAAGIASSLRRAGSGKEVGIFSDAARILRMAEGLCRSVVALMENGKGKGSDISPGGAVQSGEAGKISKSAKRRQKKKLAKSATKQTGDVTMHDSGLGIDDETPQFDINAVFGMAEAFRSGGPQAAAQFSNQSKTFFSTGSKVRITGLSSRTDLEGVIGTVVHGKLADSSDRLAVQVESGEKVQVKALNLEIIAIDVAK